ncbi:MAG: hypothetical protein H6507_05510 [Calditrichaeota bacterium]|nr:hypothetical protein [Calditrichota bacterium]
MYKASLAIAGLETHNGGPSSDSVAQTLPGSSTSVDAGPSVAVAVPSGQFTTSLPLAGARPETA